MKNQRVDDRFLERWRYSPTDRTLNSASIGMLGITATVSSKNEVAFAIRAPVNGERRNKNIGYFRPNYFTISHAIEAGRKQLDEWRAEERGERPALAASEVPRLSELVPIYVKAREEGDDDACKGGRGLPKRWDDYADLFPKVYAPLWNTKVNVIQRESIRAAHKAYLDKRLRETGKRPFTTIRFTFNAVKPMLEFAQLRYGLPLDALRYINHSGPAEEKRQRILLPREWQMIDPVLDGMYRDVGLLPRYLLATACRLSMATTMRWRDLSTINAGKPDELMIWCVPAENMKQGLTAIFPIVGEALRLIDQLRAMAGGKPGKDDFVFPENVRKAWDDNTDKWQKAIFEASGTKGWHRHDLRRTTATLLQFVGADEKTVKRLLAHADKDTGSTKVYLSLKGNVEAVTKLAVQLRKVHALYADMAAGRASGELKRLYGELTLNQELRQWMQSKGVDFDGLIEVEEREEGAPSNVTPIRKRK
jgi:integrase